MKTQVAIVGGGVIGCAVARELALRGQSVVVIDRQAPGQEASWAAAGMLAPQAEATGRGPFVDLLLEARRIYPELARQLRAETEMDIGYREHGILAVALDEADEKELAGIFGWQHAEGLEVRRLDSAELADLEPSLSEEVRSALHFPGDHQVDNRLLSRALWFAAATAGAEFLIGSGVAGIERRPGGLDLVLESGDRVSPERVVLAAGCWSGTIRGLPRTLPVHPVHGQLVSLETAPPLLTHTIVSSRGYLVPRADGRLLIGATVEDLGFQKAVTSEGVASLLAAGTELIPSLASHRVIEEWSGLRPGTPDDLPILGPDPDLPELVYATGHFRNGILLAPLTGRIIADLICAGRTEVDIDPYRADRFQAT